MCWGDCCNEMLVYYIMVNVMNFFYLINEYNYFFEGDYEVIFYVFNFFSN